MAKSKNELTATTMVFGLACGRVKHSPIRCILRKCFISFFIWMRKLLCKSYQVLVPSMFILFVPKVLDKLSSGLIEIVFTPIKIVTYRTHSLTQ